MADGSDILKGALAGLAAGLVASAVMEGVQRLIAPASDAEPATQKVADAAARTATGDDLPDDAKPLAGELVHYLTGAGLGVAYGIAAEFAPSVTKGAGTAFSGGVAAVLDQGIVPALGFGAAPWKASAGAQATSVTSHLVYGLVAEATRKAARTLLDRAF